MTVKFGNKFRCFWDPASGNNMKLVAELSLFKVVVVVVVWLCELCALEVSSLTFHRCSGFMGSIYFTVNHTNR